MKALCQQILSTLGKIGDASTSRTLLEFAKTESHGDLHAAAFSRVGEIGGSSIQKDLWQLTSHESDPTIKRVVGDALGKVSRLADPDRAFAPSLNAPLRLEQ
jgi:hypothetical protein